jgi:starvation-inducible DNA-binding protein
MSTAPVVDALGRLLAGSYTLYLKTHNYHWNVTGPMFNTLHTLFEVQYTELALAVDEIAERIRALGERAPGSYSAFAQLSAIKEDPTYPGAVRMLQNLVADQETIADAARRLVELAETNRDAASADLGVRRIQAPRQERLDAAAKSKPVS